jgi:hypothetical protein
MESPTIADPAVLGILDGFYDCSIRWLNISSCMKSINELAFGNFRLLTAIDFSGCRHLREMIGFSGCTSITKIDIPVCVLVTGYRAFNNCIGLSGLTFADGSQVREAGVIGMGVSLY